MRKTQNFNSYNTNLSRVSYTECRSYFEEVKVVGNGKSRTISSGNSRRSYLKPQTPAGGLTPSVI